MLKWKNVLKVKIEQIKALKTFYKITYEFLTHKKVILLNQ